MRPSPRSSAGGDRPPRPKWCRAWKAHQPCYQRAPDTVRGLSSVTWGVINLEGGPWTSHFHSSMTMWLLLCTCQKGNCDRTILILKLNRPQTRPLFPFPTCSLTWHHNSVHGTPPTWLCKLETQASPWAPSLFPFLVTAEPC